MTAKRFALRKFNNNLSMAKDDVDNVGAGRAAKGENLVFCAINTEMFSSSCFLFFSDLHIHRKRREKPVFFYNFPLACRSCKP